MEKRSFIFGREYSIDPRNRPLPSDPKNLYTLLDDCEERSSSSESIASASASNDTASVYLRVRPSTYGSHYRIEGNIFNILNAARTVEKQFTFSDVLGDTVMQRQVYTSSIENSVDNDENLTLLMYGTSGSGKTYTLMGDADQPGIIPRAIEHIFTRYGSSISTMPKFKPVGGDYRVLSDDEIDVELTRRQVYFQLNNQSIFSGDKEKIQSEHNFVGLQPSQTSVYVWISFFEIYNETVNDLLEIPSSATKKRDGLKMMSNSGKTFVKDLTSVFTVSSDEATKLLTTGLNYRLNASTNINHTSSRSHCLFLIDVIKREQTEIFYNRYRFCDLAGSERVKKSETTGSRLKEAQNINTSLLVLGRCLDITFNNQGKKKMDLVPFRESKLTTFLQSALKGLEKLTMIVNIWPIPEFYEENLHVLNYASMAQKIVYKPPPPPAQRHSVSKRYSFFLGPQPKEDSNVSILLDENYRLKQINEEFADENDQLYATIEELEERNARLVKLTETIEVDVRKELSETLMKELQKKEQQTEQRLQVRIDYLIKTHKKDMQELEGRLERRENEIDSLYEEIEKLKRANGHNNDDIDEDEDSDDTSAENSTENSVENTSHKAVNGHDDSDTITID